MAAMLKRGLTEDGAAQALGWSKARVTAWMKLLERAQQLICAGVIPLAAVDQLRTIGAVAPKLLDAVIAYLDDDNAWGRRAPGARARLGARPGAARDEDVGLRRSEFVTAACVTYLPRQQCLRWAYAGHPPALWLDDGQELTAPTQGTPLGVRADSGCLAGSPRSTAGAGVLLYTDGLTEARRDRIRFTGTAGCVDAPSGFGRRFAVAAVRGFLVQAVGRIESVPAPSAAKSVFRQRSPAFRRIGVPNSRSP